MNHSTLSTAPLPRPTGRHRRTTARTETGVPLSVWLSEPLSGCCTVCAEPGTAACAGRLPLGLASQIVEAFSSPGDLVYVPDAGNGALLTAGVRTGRKVLGYARSADAARRLHEQLAGAAPQVASLAVLRRAETGQLPAHADRTQHRAALTVLAPHQPTDSREFAALLDASVRTLRPGGVLVFTSRQSSGLTTAGHLVAYGQAAGLTYLQHIAAVEAPAAGDTLTPARTRRHGPECTCPDTGNGTGPHALVHNDLVVLTKPR